MCESFTIRYCSLCDSALPISQGRTLKHLEISEPFTGTIEVNMVQKYLLSDKCSLELNHLISSLENGKIPLCNVCVTLVSKIYDWDMEVTRIQGLIDDEIANVKRKLLELFCGQPSCNATDSNVLRLRQLILVGKYLGSHTGGHAPTVVDHIEVVKHNNVVGICIPPGHVIQSSNESIFTCTAEEGTGNIMTSNFNTNILDVPLESDLTLLGHVTERYDLPSETTNDKNDILGTVITTSQEEEDGPEEALSPAPSESPTILEGDNDVGVAEEVEIKEEPLDDNDEGRPDFDLDDFNELVADEGIFPDELAKGEKQPTVRPGRRRRPKNKASEAGKSTGQSPRGVVNQIAPGRFDYRGYKISQVGDSGKYQCETCLGVFTSKNGARVHVKHAHLNEKPNKPKQCPLCGKVFTSPTNYYYHLRAHSDDRPHICDVCGKSFKTNSNLHSHKFTHRVTLPFLCKFEGCGKRFVRMNQLKIHQVLHTRESPHVCELCQKVCPTITRLKRHMLKHTKEKPFACERCGKAFKHQSHVTLHIRRVCNVENSGEKKD